MIKLRFFGRLGDVASNAPSTISGDYADASEVRRALSEDCPALGRALREPQVMIAIDQSVADWQTPLPDECELAFLPPVTGG